MTDSRDLTPAEITDYITSTYAGTDVVTTPTGDAIFFSRDPDKHWPNFATIVTTDEHDQAPGLPPAPANLGARGLFRLNIGVGPEMFKRLVDPSKDYDFTAVDQLMPHPVYAAQRWVCIVNPSRETFEASIKPLLTEAYERLRPPAGTA